MLSLSFAQNTFDWGGKTWLPVTRERGAGIGVIAPEVRMLKFLNSRQKQTNLEPWV